MLGYDIQKGCCMEGPAALGGEVRKYCRERWGNTSSTTVRSTMSCQICPMLQESGLGLCYLFICSSRLWDNDLWDHDHLRDHLWNDLLVISKTSELCLSLDFFITFHQPVSSLCSYWPLLKLLAIPFTKCCQPLWNHLFFLSFLAAQLLHVLTPFLFTCAGKEAFAPCSCILCRVWFPWHLVLLNPGSCVICWMSRFL